MKMSKLVALVLSCVMLVSVLCVPASAEGMTVNFEPVLNGGRLYGTALETPQTALRAIYYPDYKSQIEIYNAERERLSADDDTLIGTGFTVKLGKMYYSTVVMGDIDGDGELTPLDYVLIKRAFLGTFTVSSLAMEASGVENGGELRAINYIKVKRAYFGTYDINKEYTCEPYDPTAGGDGWSEGWV